MLIKENFRKMHYTNFTNKLNLEIDNVVICVPTWLGDEVLRYLDKRYPGCVCEGV